MPYRGSPSNLDVSTSLKNARRLYKRYLAMMFASLLYLCPVRRMDSERMTWLALVSKHLSVVSGAVIHIGHHACK